MLRFYNQTNNEEASYEQNTIILEFQNLWRTETHAPEILPYQGEAVATIKSLLEQQQELIDSKTDEQVESEYFTLTVYQAELDRVRYSLMKYLRTRLIKVEQQLEHILGDLELMDRLSAPERLYATKLNNLTNQYMEDTIITRLPPTCAEYFQQNEDRYKQATPNLQMFVFCQALEDIAELLVGRDTYQSFSKGDISVIRYGAIRHCVLQGQMQLL